MTMYMTHISGLTLSTNKEDKQSGFKKDIQNIPTSKNSFLQVFSLRTIKMVEVRVCMYVVIHPNSHKPPVNILLESLI